MTLPPPLIRPSRGDLPVLLSVPHAGRDYPDWLLAMSNGGRAALHVLEDPFVDGPFVVVVLVVLGEFALAFVLWAASAFSARAAAATNAAGSAIHLVIAPPFETVEQGTYPVPTWDSSA